MELTRRQREVADGLVRGQTIAAIAGSLALTESRVNQIIRALKDRFEVDTQAGIVAAYQRALEQEAVRIAEPVETEAVVGESLVPGILNAPHPLLYRLLVICLGAFLLAATFFLLAHFAIMLSDVSDGHIRAVSRDRADGGND